MGELVDVVITVYNKEKTIQRCLDSILNQDYKNLNVIIVDDGSSDNSYNICSNYMDHRIKIISQKNSGVGAARNAGIRYLSGSKVVFIDADDYVSPTYIKDLLKYSQYQLVVQGYIVSQEDGNNYKNIVPKMRQISFGQFGDYLNSAEIYKFMTMLWNKLFDTRIVVENNLRFRELSTGEDVCFVFDYLEHIKEIIFTQDSNYHYVLSTGSLSRKDIPDIWERQKDINNYCRKLFYPKYGKIWSNMYIRAAKRTLGEAAGNKDKFYKQINKVYCDDEFKEVKIQYLDGVITKVIYFLILTRNDKWLWIIFRLA